MMMAAAELGHSSAARQLLIIEPEAALNFNASDTDDSPLHMALLCGHLALFKQLLAAAPEAVAATWNHTDSEGSEYEGWSLMHTAAVSGCAAEAVQHLLQLGTTASGVTDFGHTPLHEACGKGNLGAARMLLEAAPQMAPVEDDLHFLPLHWAAAHGNVGVIRLLLAAGAPGLDKRTHAGKTPLHMAVECCSKADAARILLDACPAAAMMANTEGQRPLHCALQPPQPYMPDGDPATKLSIARQLLPVSELSADQLLDTFAAAGSGAQPLYADLVAFQPLSASQWERVPEPCGGLARALPTVLARSDGEAGRLVRRLSAADRERLRLAALCLARAQRLSNVMLPAPAMRSILGQCLADD